jgi:NAD(P)-dependent dehydrogenase (short-subunit alcohol dehydrogenase family)
MQLANRVALITGAGRGIGRAIALAYAKEGARLALAARTRSELEETGRQAEALGAAACVIPTDVSDQGQVDAMVQRTLERYGTVDILVNNAGVIGPIGPLQDNDVSQWMRPFQVNLFGTFLCCRAVLPVMLQQDRGKIINVTSGTNYTDAAPYRWPPPQYGYMAAYLSSKVALTQLTESLSYQLVGKNIQVNAMHPSGRTSMVEEAKDRRQARGEETGYPPRPVGVEPLQRSGELAVFLASEASGSLSGRVLMVFDDFTNLPPRIPEIMASDAYTLRRVEEA